MVENYVNDRETGEKYFCKRSSGNCLISEMDSTGLEKFLMEDLVLSCPCVLQLTVEKYMGIGLQHYAFLTSTEVMRLGVLLP
jgi:hypothetical protein